MINKLSQGVGINDLPNTEENKPYHGRWHKMLFRCYSSKYHAKRPTYKSCTVCDEWLTFSNFKKWMELQDWKGKELDKDLLVQGNKAYSPDTCCFVDQKVNSLLLDHGGARGKYKIGVGFLKSKNKFISRCKNNGKQVYLGLYKTEAEAFDAYKKYKYKIIRDVAELQDEPLRSALNRYVITDI